MVKKFDIAPPGPKRFTLVFPHIPKTGGTTLLYHFRRHLGDKSILSYGQHNRVVRFFENLPQLEEMDADEIGKLHVVQGHSVSSDILPLLGSTKVKLLVVLRHPVGLTRSRFNQRKIGLSQRGLDIDSESFLARDPENFISSTLLDKFNIFIDPQAQTTRDKVISVLRKFDYVFTTERLDQQIQGLVDEMNLSGKLERRRVAETKAELDVTDAALAKHHALDLELFNIANTVVSEKDGHNPFGFDAEGRRGALKTLALQAKTGQPRKLYGELARALCQDLRAEAALEKLSEGGRVALRNPAHFRRILQSRWEKVRGALTSERAQISSHWLNEWRANNAKLKS